MTAARCPEFSVRLIEQPALGWQLPFRRDLDDVLAIPSKPTAGFFWGLRCRHACVRVGEGQLHKTRRAVEAAVLFYVLATQADTGHPALVGTSRTRTESARFLPTLACGVLCRAWREHDIVRVCWNLLARFRKFGVIVPMQIIQNRRTFLAGLSAASSAGLFKVQSSIAAGEPAPETPTIRLPMPSAACLAPLSLAEDLLHEEGFTEVRYVPSSMTAGAMVPDGDVDLDMQSWSDFLPLVDAERPITVLAGIQVGCMELRVKDSIRSVADLRGKRVGVNAIGATDHMLVGG